jgi:hypothetical protein
MLCLDHFVIHIDQDQTKLESLKDKIVQIGFPIRLLVRGPKDFR